MFDNNTPRRLPNNNFSDVILSVVKNLFLGILRLQPQNDLPMILFNNLLRGV